MSVSKVLFSLVDPPLEFNYPTRNAKRAAVNIFADLGSLKACLGHVKKVQKIIINLNQFMVNKGRWFIRLD